MQDFSALQEIPAQNPPVQGAGASYGCHMTFLRTAQDDFTRACLCRIPMMRLFWFHQIEGLVVGENIPLMQGTLQLIDQKMFEDRSIRLRPSFTHSQSRLLKWMFPASGCGGAGYNVCKRSGWIEIMGWYGTSARAGNERYWCWSTLDLPLVSVKSG